MREIKAQELRIGNLIKVENSLRDESGYIHQVTEIRSLDCQVRLMNLEQVYSQYYKFIKPIPLTEEWLIKLGFDSLGEYGYGIGRFHIVELIGKLRFPINNKYHHIEYVHQLQNLYHSLTGKELEPQNKELK